LFRLHSRQNHNSVLPGYLVILSINKIKDARERTTIRSGDLKEPPLPSHGGVMRAKVLLITLSVLLLNGVVWTAPKKTLFLEWEYKPDGGLGQLWRKHEVDCSRQLAGDVTTYRLSMLEKSELTATETDDGRTVTAAFKPTVEMTIEKDERGDALSIKMKIGQMVHHDLNADGIFDGVIDITTGQAQIVFNGQFVEVEKSKRQLIDRGARSPDRKVEYIFEGAKWRVWKGK
jgi:hypothetical protein